MSTKDKKSKDVFYGMIGPITDPKIIAILRSIDWQKSLKDKK